MRYINERDKIILRYNPAAESLWGKISYADKSKLIEKVTESNKRNRNNLSSKKEALLSLPLTFSEQNEIDCLSGETLNVLLELQPLSAVLKQKITHRELVTDEEFQRVELLDKTYEDRFQHYTQRCEEISKKYSKKS